jgi:hypothetical protein
MGKEFSELMRFSEEPSGDPTFSSYIQSDVTPQTIPALREGVDQARGTAGEEFDVQFLGAVAEALEAGKRIRFVPVILEEGIMPFVVVSIMPLKFGKPEASFTMLDEQANNYLEVLFPATGSPNEDLSRDDYRNKLKEHLKRGNRVVFSPARKLN